MPTYLDAHENIIMPEDVHVRAREIDFVTQFQRNWQALQDVMGITRPIKKQPGTKLKSKYAEGVLQSGNVAPGAVIPRSKYVVREKDYEDLTIEKYSKEVPIETVQEHGYDVAVQMTDDEMIVDLQEVVSNRFYGYLKTGTMTFTERTFQMAFAMTMGKVKDKFKKMHRNVTGIAVFVNTLDLYAYLGNSEISLQTAFGFSYMKDFLGAELTFVSSEIPRGMMIGTPINNIVSYYIDPADSDFAKMGLKYTVVGETNLLGFHAQGDYDRATGVSYALMGFVLWAEYIDAVAVVTIDPNATNVESENIPAQPTLGTLTVTSAAGTASGSTAITVSPALASGNTYKYKVGENAANVTAGQNVQTWQAWDGESDITAESGKKITVVECDRSYRAVKAGSATVVSNSGLG